MTPNLRSNALRYICGQSHTIGSLAAAIGISASLVSRYVDELVALRLVRRKTNPDDARSVLVLPTAAGKRAAEKRLSVAAE